MAITATTGAPAVLSSAAGESTVRVPHRVHLSRNALRSIGRACRLGGTNVSLTARRTRNCNRPAVQPLEVSASQEEVPPETLALNTPFFQSVPMSEALGAPVWIKMDALQPSGSYKLRGVSHACLKARAAGASKLVSSSGGNAGLAVAYTGQQMGMAVTVVLPESTPAFVQARLEAHGAEVVVFGSQWSEANDRACQLAADQGGVLIHPFDMPDLWAGHATLVHEVKAALGEEAPGAVVVSVGGGGLLMGVLEGLHQVGWGEVPTVATETHGADCLAQSLAAGEAVTLPGITSIAKSLGAASPSPVVFGRCQELGAELVQPWVCDDRQAVSACLRFAEDHRVLVEPACGAALAAVYERAPVLQGRSSVVVEVCGGAIVGPALMDQWRKDFDL